MASVITWSSAGQVSAPGRRVAPAQWTVDKGQALTKGRWQPSMLRGSPQFHITAPSLEAADAASISDEEDSARRRITHEYYNFFSVNRRRRFVSKNVDGEIPQRSNQTEVLPLLLFMCRCVFVLERSTRRAWIVLQERHFAHLQLGDLMGRHLLERGVSIRLFLYERELLFGPEWVALESVTRELIETEFAASLRLKIGKWHKSFYSVRSAKPIAARQAPPQVEGTLDGQKSPDALNFTIKIPDAQDMRSRRSTGCKHCCALGEEHCRQEIMIARAPHDPAEIVGQHRHGAPYYTSFFPMSPTTEKTNLTRRCGSAASPFPASGIPICISAEGSKLHNAKLVFVHHHRPTLRESDSEDSAGELTSSTHPKRLRADRRTKRCDFPEECPAAQSPSATAPHTAAKLRARKVADTRQQYSERNRSVVSNSLAKSRDEMVADDGIFASTETSPKAVESSRLFRRFVAPLLRLPSPVMKPQHQQLLESSLDNGFSEWVRCIGLAPWRRPRSCNPETSDDEDSPPSSDGDHDVVGGDSLRSSVPVLPQNIWEFTTKPHLALPGYREVPEAHQPPAVPGNSRRPLLTHVLSAVYLTPVELLLLPDVIAMVPSTSGSGEEEKISIPVSVKDVLPFLADDDLFWHLVSLWEDRDPHVFDPTNLSRSVRQQLRRTSSAAPAGSTGGTPADDWLTASTRRESNAILGFSSSCNVVKGPVLTAAHTKLPTDPSGIAIRHRVDQIAWLAATVRLQQLSYPHLPLRVRGVFSASLIVSDKEHAELAAARASSPAETELIMIRYAKAAERRQLMKLLPCLPSAVLLRYHHRQPPYVVQIPLEDLDLLTDPTMLALIKEYAVQAASSTATFSSSVPAASRGLNQRMSHSQVAESIMRCVPALTTGEMLLLAAVPPTDILDEDCHRRSSSATTASADRPSQRDEEQLPLSSAAFSAITNPGTPLRGSRNESRFTLVVPHSPTTPNSKKVDDRRWSTWSEPLSTAAAWFPRRFSTFGHIPSATTPDNGPTRRSIQSPGVPRRETSSSKATPAYSRLDLLNQRIIAHVSHVALLYRRQQLAAHLEGLEHCFAIPIEMLEPYLVTESPELCDLCRKLSQELMMGRQPVILSDNVSEVLKEQSGDRCGEAVSIKERALLAAHYVLPRFAEDFFVISDALLSIAQHHGATTDLQVSRSRSSFASPPQVKRVNTSVLNSGRPQRHSPQSNYSCEDDLVSLSSQASLNVTQSQANSLAEDIMMTPMKLSRASKESGTTGAIAAAVRLAFATASVQQSVSRYLHNVSLAPPNGGSAFEPIDHKELADMLESARQAIIDAAVV
jgi:hypothetical protein